MLIGEFNHNIDEKGRLTIPSKMRHELGENFIITKGLDGCLFAYSINEWANFEDKLSVLPSGRKETREIQRFFFSGASDVSFDKQGRVLIPQNLRDHAGLSKEVVIAGVSKRLEIWDKEKWDNLDEDSEKSIEDIAEEFGKLGIY
ncbi:MAG: division/cell wall cluster transcriptional repressor MraZ [Ezakiella sp.]|nr:division/cell wall cluster transcriptional repressor MraZ [Ezakiella sp.]MDD7761768.1 division/cell wall cluster transcriptional repressor MraZ [Bacillota bacterium]MDY3946583.1 division/cell wall cluster transcriptional repressor MraZ [Ezakiella sp.]